MENVSFQLIGPSGDTWNSNKRDACKVGWLYMIYFKAERYRLHTARQNATYKLYSLISTPRRCVEVYWSLQTINQSTILAL